MKRTLLVIGLTFIMSVPAVLAGDGYGSAFGTLATAQAIGQGRGTFGVGIGLADATSFVGTFNYGLSKYTDGRLKLGLVDTDGNDTEFTLGADFKWQFWSYGKNGGHPFDFAVGGFFEYGDFANRSVFQVGGQLIGSIPVRLKSGRLLVPYARFNARMESLGDIQRQGKTAIDSESNLEVGLNAGVQWELTSTMALFGEFQFGGNDGLFMGIDFNVM